MIEVVNRARLWLPLNSQQQSGLMMRHFPVLQMHACKISSHGIAAFHAGCQAKALTLTRLSCAMRAAPRFSMPHAHSAKAASAG